MDTIKCLYRRVLCKTKKNLIRNQEHLLLAHRNAKIHATSIRILQAEQFRWHVTALSRSISQKSGKHRRFSMAFKDVPISLSYPGATAKRWKD
ncbi:uncharacterized protein LOC143426758 isoform X2 [Xylocopa sonorina]|uniref:uncharacterized protein LOC143426758 isoform X2 n=1 Tax=Xylocopa sonorina TaxID=1818115 RepID=UPI00403B17A9